MGVTKEQVMGVERSLDRMDVYKLWIIEDVAKKAGWPFLFEHLMRVMKEQHDAEITEVIEVKRIDNERIGMEVRVFDQIPF